MFRFFRYMPLIVLLLMAVGCARNYYNIPRESYEKKVRVLGVAPFFADGDSDIRHPEREALLALLRDLNRKNEAELVARLKETGAYLSVRMPDAEADQLFASLFFRRERRSDAGVIYNKYFYKQQELKEFIEKNQLDAVMLVTVSGLTKPGKVYSGNYMAYLESDFNFLTMTAQILDADGNILWEYPNFQQRPFSLTPLLNLQYVDFDESEANISDRAEVRNKTISGITRAFAKTASFSVRKDANISLLYSKVFDEMVSLLEPELRLPWEKEKREGRDQQAGPAPDSPPKVEPRAPATTPGAGKLEPAGVAPPKAEPAGIATEPGLSAPGEIQTETLK